jgi:hypothetical protein
MYPLQVSRLQIQIQKTTILCIPPLNKQLLTSLTSSRFFFTRFLLAGHAELLLSEQNTTFLTFFGTDGRSRTFEKD